MRSPAFLVRSALALAALAARLASADLSQEIQAAGERLKPLLPQLEAMDLDGHFSDANRKLLAAFPADQRTPVQCLVLGNLLYAADAKLSYAMHQQAALALPQEPDVQLEWAMEQHRAGEWAGALSAYDRYAQAHAEYAPVHGLAADCLIRLGRIPDAVARWRQSEQAPRGTLEDFETLDCDVYMGVGARARREAWIDKVRAGSIDAALQLIFLDCQYERDWWNTGPDRAYLKHDLPLLATFTSPRVDAARCAAECYLLEDPKPDDVRPLLLKHGFIIDASHTLPPDASMASLLYDMAARTALIDGKEARERFGPALAAQARASKDPCLWNLVADLYRGQARLQDIDQAGWLASGDARFAGSYLCELSGDRKRSAEAIALFQQAERQFPEDAYIWLMAIDASGNPTADMLVHAITAEYRRFSYGEVRPDAQRLRRYFAALAHQLK